MIHLLKSNNLKHIAVVIIFITCFYSCKKDKEVEIYTKSENVKMGNGYVYSWIRTDFMNKPIALGFTLTKAALENLSGDSCEANHNHSSFEMKIPSQASKTPFDHIVINWNSNGHEPFEIYGIPHFDFHFYMITSEEKEFIPLYEADSMKFKNAPPAEYLPSGYIYPGGGEPQMGAHWIDPASPELNGENFTETFIYGTFDGKVNFIEPMITYDFFVNISDFTRKVPRPAKVKITGYYPQKLKITKSKDDFIVSLNDFEYRIAE